MAEYAKGHQAVPGAMVRTQQDVMGQTVGLPGVAAPDFLPNRDLCVATRQETALVQQPAALQREAQDRARVVLRQQFLVIDTVRRQRREQSGLHGVIVLTVDA
ncbi:MAG: hypothetical protein OXC93_15265 [Rhodospirillaceae bacterium]|nr:hypothetical protein [Rhodospirillaceae bacterium]